MGWARIALASAGAAALVLACLAPAPSRAAPPDSLQRELTPFLRRYCHECHAGSEPEGELRLDRPLDAEAWSRVRSLLAAGDMPPPEAKQRPTREEVATVVSAIEAVARQPSDDPGRVTLRRLNRREYDHTLRDLLGLHLELSRGFPDDDVGYGYDTVGDVLTVSPLLLERLLDAAEQAAEAAILAYEPITIRVEAEEARRNGRGGRRGTWEVLSTQGDFSLQVYAPCTGRYRLLAHVYGDQAGPEPVVMDFLVDGERAARRRVEATRERPRVYQHELQLTRGPHTVAVAFTNDYYRPDDPDPSQRDRNMAVDWIGVSGPVEPPPLPAAQARYLRRRPGPGAGAAEREEIARETLAPLARRAFRRPVREEELARLVALVEEALAAGDSWEQAMRLALQALLVSPEFLYRFELDERPHDPRAVRPLTQHELASRMSYFLWSSMPDDRLLDLADAGQLDAQLGAEARRLLDDPRASALIEGFFAQWLGLGQLERVLPDPGTYPEFDEPLRAAMRAETELVCEAILREGRSALDLLQARFTFVNERLAAHYGIPGVRGERFRRVALPPERGGVVTHASVLTITSNPTRTSPVKRGKWLLERILADPPPPPPPGVDTLPEKERGGETLSLREQLTLHRERASCRVCHERMDALGFGLEAFDGVGALRLGPVDALGELPDGTRFEGPAELRGVLTRAPRAFLRGLASELLVYALGRGTLPGDAAALDSLLDTLAPDYRLDELIVGLVQLDTFRRRRGEER